MRAQICKHPADAKISWNFNIQMEKHHRYNKPDITVVEKKHLWLVVWQYKVMVK